MPAGRAARAVRRAAPRSGPVASRTAPARVRANRAPRKAPVRIAVLGAGALGTALARALTARRVHVVLWSHSPARARSAARAIGCTAAVTLEEAVGDADLVLLCGRDAALPELAARLAGLELPARARIAFHTSGAIGARVLARLARAGFATGALHPLVPVPPDADAGVFEGAGFALEARAPAVRAVGAALARELGGASFVLSAAPRERERYHAAATLVSNGALALTALALRELLPPRLSKQAGGGAARAFAVLLQRTAQNLAERAPERALTGPVARGDFGTLRKHLAVLPRGAPAGKLYRLLSRELARIAERGGRVDRRTARALDRLFA